MEWAIQPLRSVGPVDFGMPRADVRRVVGARFREFVKSPDRPLNRTDAFEELLIHVYYASESGTCELVEFGGGSARPLLHGRDLLRESFSDLCAWLRSLDPALTEDDSGQFAPPCRHPICRVMPPEGRVERPVGMMPRIEGGVDRQFRSSRRPGLEDVCRVMPPPAGRPSRWRRSAGVAGQRRRRGRARGFCAGEGGVVSSASSFGLSLGRYDVTHQRHRDAACRGPCLAVRPATS